MVGESDLPSGDRAQDRDHARVGQPQDDRRRAIATTRSNSGTSSGRTHHGARGVPVLVLLVRLSDARAAICHRLTRRRQMIACQVSGRWLGDVGRLGYMVVRWLLERRRYSEGRVHRAAPEAPCTRPAHRPRPPRRSPRRRSQIGWRAVGVPPRCGRRWPRVSDVARSAGRAPHRVVTRRSTWRRVPSGTLL